MPVQLTSRFQDALALAIQLHGGQVRKGTDAPYIAHLLAVSAIVLEHGGSEDEAIAALLHDSVEDAGGAATLSRVADQFGPNVAGIVDDCSEPVPEPGQPKAPWRERKDAYLAHLAEVSPSALLVAAADKLHNVRSIQTDYSHLGEALWSRFNAGRDEILWFYRALVEAMDSAETSLLLDEAEGSTRFAGLDRLLDEFEEAVENLHLDVELTDSAALLEDVDGSFDEDDGLELHF